MLSALQLTVPPAASATPGTGPQGQGSTCPDETTFTGFAGSTECIARGDVKTRGWGLQQCISDPKAIIGNAIYLRGECRGGGGKLIQAEAIAQARLIAKLNLNLGSGASANGVSPRIQWEVSPGSSPRRIDIAVYDRSNPSSIGFAELRASWGGRATRAPEDLRSYLTLWNGQNYQSTATAYSVAGLVGDQFVVRTGVYCRKATDVKAYEYTTRAGSAGVVLIDRSPVYCTGSADEEGEDAASSDGYHGSIGVDANANGRDDFLDWIDEHRGQFGDAMEGIRVIPAVLVTGQAVRVYMSPEAIRMFLSGWRTAATAGVAMDTGGAEVIDITGRLAVKRALQFGMDRLAIAALEEAGAVAIEVAIAMPVVAIVVAAVVILAVLAFRHWHLWGDPHLVTLDNLTYDLQSAGEFHLIEVPDHGIDVQARFTPYGQSVSVMGSVAFDLGSSRVEIRRDGTAFLDGTQVDLANGTDVGLNNFDTGYGLAYQDGEYVAIFPTGEVLSTNGMDLAFAPSGTAVIRGLLGNHDGAAGNDLVTRSGEQISPSAVSVIHGRFADSWRVTDDTSLFTYADGQSTATFTDRTFPQTVVTEADFPTNQVDAARTTCRDHNVPEGPQFDDCVLDVLVTGDTAYAKSAAATSNGLVDQLAKPFNAAGTLAENFEETAVPKNFVAPRYSTDTSTTRIAGPLFDTGSYRFDVQEVGRHNGLTLDADVYAFGPVTTDNNTQSVAVKVNGDQRGTILFDGGPARLADGLNGTLAQTGSGVTADGRAFAKYRLHAPVGVVGESLSVEFAPKNFGGVFNTSLGLDNLALALDVPIAQRFAVSEPASVPGAAGSGVLESVGAADIFDFTVAAAQAGKAHVINASDCDVSLTLSLVNTDTGALVGRWPETCSRITTPTLAAGRYALTVTPYASAGSGSYAMEFFVKPDPQRFTLPLGTTVKNGTPTTGAGNLETVASQDVYAFTAEAGGLYLDQRACAPGESWVLRLARSGDEVSSGGCYDQQFDGLNAGDYELVISTNDTKPGTYGFQLFKTPVAPQEFTAPFPMTVTDQEPAAGAGNLETKMSVDRYLFTMTAAAPLYVDVQSCLPTGSLGWKVIKTADSTVVDSGNCSDKQTVELAAGEYRLEMASVEEGYGPYEFQAWPVPMTPQVFPVTIPTTISNGHPSTGAGDLETKASQDVYSFTLADDKPAIYVDQVGCSKANMLTWELINDVSGYAVTVANGDCSDQQVRQVAHGSYRLVVTPVGEAHGTYSLRITPSNAGSPVIVHTPQTTAYNAKPIPIEATTTCKAPAACFAKLVYRVSGTHTGDTLPGRPAGAWKTLVMTKTSTTTVADGQNVLGWAAEIPGQIVTTTGVDYYLSAGDGDDRNEFPAAVRAPLGLTGAGGSLGADVAETPYLHVATVSPPLLVHTNPIYAYPDKDLPLELRATCSTGSCTATLHYRTSTGITRTVDLTGDPGWPTIKMTPSATTALGDAGTMITYTATIPGNKVDTRGVDYYFDVTDTHTTSYWPGTTYQGFYAPTDGMRTTYETVHVLEPPHVVHQPVLTNPYKTATSITATGTCPTGRTCTARLYYRTTTNTGNIVADSALTDHDFTDTAMTLTKVPGVLGSDVITVTGTIPASFADTRGMDYFFRIDDGSTTTWYPGSGQVQGYVSVPGTRVAYQHVRVLEPPHIIANPVLATKALQPYPITSTMTCVTANCSMTLHWRNDLAPGETDPGWHSVPMTKTGVPTVTPLGTQYTYTYAIPAEKVTTRGLAYYLEGYDGHVHDFAPGTSYWGAYLPMDGTHLDASTPEGGSPLVIGSFIVRVLEPPHLVHTPPGVVEKGQPLALTATSNCSSSSCPATLTWTDNDGKEQKVVMTATRNVDGASINPAVPGDVWTYTASISGDDTRVPVNYTISVTDGYTSDSTPALQALVYEKPA